MFKNITVYLGRNAIHIAINIHTKRWGYICFHPLFRMYGKWWPSYFYLSPDGTPTTSTYLKGREFSKEEKDNAKERKENWGHNFNTRLHYGNL